MASTDHIRYDLLAQDALRGVVRRVLSDVARDGLPGDHHFFVAFDTRAPGVRLSPRMREKYPEDMTIVLQHQFWDLVVTDQAFEVGLSFGGIPERLLVPFSALKGFFDPSVKFGLQFELADEAAAAEPAGDGSVPLNAAVRPMVRGAASEPQLAPGAEGSLGRDGAKTEPAKVGSPAKAEPGEAGEDAAEIERAEGGAEVVRLDVFRKK